MADARTQIDEAGYSRRPARPDVAQVVGIVGGPLAVLLGLQARYTLAEAAACKSDAGFWSVHVVALLALLLALGAGVVAHRQWPPASRGADPEDLGGPEGRRRTLASIGVSISALSAIVIVAMWLPQLVVSPCRP